MRTLVCRLLVLGVGLWAAGCGGDGTSPAAPSTLPPEPFLSVWITSGDGGKPVAGARVSIDGVSYVSNETGAVTPAGPGAPRGSAIDVDADGFLPRRTRIPATRVITLWPVAGEAEAEAVREMVYGRGGGDVLHPPDIGPFWLVFLDPSEAPDLAHVWQAEATAFGDRFERTVNVSIGPRFDELDGALVTNEVVVRFEGTGCDPVPAWGLCQVSPASKTFLVQADRAGDPRTIRRLLASWFLGPNPLPGLMNPDAPADELSPLEEQSIRMILQRPLPNRWPDTDR
jgi:hypothetical protein